MVYQGMVNHDYAYLAHLIASQAADHGNEDAKDRLSQLSQPSPNTISRSEHETLTEAKLVRKRTTAKQRSDASGMRSVDIPASQSALIVENARNSTQMTQPAVGVSRSSGEGARPRVLGPQGVPYAVPQGTPPSNSTSPRQRPIDLGQEGGTPASQSPRPWANAPRYALTDPGSNSAQNPRPPPQQNNFGPPRRDGRPGASPGPEQNEVEPPRNTGPPKKGPQTFAEMGITTAKVEEKECVIM